MEIFEKLNEAYKLKIQHHEVLNHDALAQLLKEVAKCASCEIDMFLLPLLSTCCGLMGTSVIKTHRENIMLEEPNILWSYVAAEPGITLSYKIYL